MIYVERPSKPLKLTEELRKKLTDKFKETNKDVWKSKYITKPLIEMSHGKCVFCECRLGEEGKYMEVEHFYPKSLYPDKVVLWGNLFPICSRCNKAKRNHDTLNYPIINPCLNNPKDHLYFENFNIFGKDSSPLGSLTEIVLNLNDTLQVVTPRFQVGTLVIQKLKEIAKMVKRYDRRYASVGDDHDIVNKTQALLQHALPRMEYSATVATVIVSSRFYEQMKDDMITKSLWNDDLDQLDSIAREISLEVALAKMT
ncbi:HNH endonuclease [Bacillus cereus]|uniref:HNH endonuclease n=1 Tax=Bacillus cereus TaxID=1396 RepID=UPI0023608981|nr:HNH endonuclease [Bacillus cereus]MDD0822633.1 HNH endonuclease [Bacillus cereus]